MSQQDSSLPKGRVTEVCQEWMVREDGALAYRLQNQEISEHLSGNKHRNQLVREDFPKAKTEQLREQLLAEQTALIYQRMLAEQEEQDNHVARQLAERLEREERQKRRLLESQDKDVARQILERERLRVEELQTQQPPAARSHDKLMLNANVNLNLSSPIRRQAKQMPLPQAQSQNVVGLPQIQPKVYHNREVSDLYTEPYQSYKNPASEDNLVNQLDRIDIVEVGLPLDELSERQIQEEKDAELARQLQEQEGSLEYSMINRDRMLAIEAQDKELAKLLQERERIKAKKARERAKQKALAKKQQQLESANMNPTGNMQIMPDDSYSYPADLIPPRTHLTRVSDTYALPHQGEDDLNYSLPADVLTSKSNYSLQKTINGSESSSSIRPSFENGDSGTPAVRPTQLDLKSPLTRINKPRYPDPDCDTTASGSASSPSHINIAMQIDPTYPRRGIHSSSSFETSSSTVTTSTSSSSPSMVLPPPDIAELDDDDGVAPPYMPIQGQRRTASLEKKQKKKSKEGGCKQQ